MNDHTKTHRENLLQSLGHFSAHFRNDAFDHAIARNFERVLSVVMGILKHLTELICNDGGEGLIASGNPLGDQPFEVILAPRNLKSVNFVNVYETNHLLWPHPLASRTGSLRFAEFF